MGLKDGAAVEESVLMHEGDLSPLRTKLGRVLQDLSGRIELAAVAKRKNSGAWIVVEGPEAVPAVRLGDWPGDLRR